MTQPTTAKHTILLVRYPGDTYRLYLPGSCATLGATGIQPPITHHKSGARYITLSYAQLAALPKLHDDYIITAPVSYALVAEKSPELVQLLDDGTLASTSRYLSRLTGDVAAAAPELTTHAGQVRDAVIGMLTGVLAPRAAEQLRTHTAALAVTNIESVAYWQMVGDILAAGAVADAAGRNGWLMSPKDERRKFGRRA